MENEIEKMMIKNNFVSPISINEEERSKSISLSCGDPKAFEDLDKEKGRYLKKYHELEYLSQKDLENLGHFKTPIKDVESPDKALNHFINTG